MIYVRHLHRDTWHFWANCSAVRKALARPSSGLVRLYVQDGKRPSTGECCNECLSKETAGAGVPIKPEVNDTP